MVFGVQAAPPSSVGLHPYPITMATDDTKTRATECYEIIRATQRPMPALDVDGRELKFRPNGMMRVKDRGLAMAARDLYKGEITVTKCNVPSPADIGHRYTFSTPRRGMPWARYDEFGKRIYDPPQTTSQPPQGADSPARGATDPIRQEGE